MKIRKGDQVIVIAGNSKGQRGEVLRVDRKHQRVVVSGVNLVKKHQKPQNIGGRQQAGGIIEFEAPIHVSNVMLIDPTSNEPTRVAIRRDENGRPVRYAKKSGNDIG